MVTSVVAVLIVCILIATIFVIILWNSKKTLPFREGLYFQVVDTQGTESSVHDSGYDPTIQELKLQILKREINDKRAIVLVTPSEVRLGGHPQYLDQTVQIRPQDIEDRGEYYVVHVVR